MNRDEGKKVYVWNWGARVIHWMIALSFTTAFVTSFYEELLHDHVALGFIFGVMILYRIIWGFIGPRYAQFKNFMLKPSQFIFYFKEKVQNRWRKIPAGHNPASSWYTVWAMVMGTIIVISGLLLYGVQEAKGLLSYLNETHTQYIGILEIIHQYASYIFVAWVFIHITGVLIEQFWHKTHMVFAMITGYKKTEGEDTTVSIPLTIFSFSFIIMGILTYLFIVSSNYNFLTLQKYGNLDYEEIHSVYHEECGDCHKTYPPYILPQKSWKKIMATLDNHRGEEITEANISKVEQQSILKFLLANSAESSTREAAVKMMDSLGKRRPKAITKTPYWRETHKNIPKSVYKSREVKDKSNCFACHKDFEHGNLDDMNIKKSY
ncbi:cytochrome C [Sulfurovum sp. bin170]|uniref:cytochrome b/b6 domain-containing protein n=1 Tax=Sulfurovum sp. bin170 TaxID=2695268 RepID=UPI0013E08C5B|nr:cytochrome b/b6 domain-containing protein [Sulfurovum sp. bin170]NEW60472.1 cytochrome C [Sulfurovum sp. bin170]